MKINLQRVFTVFLISVIITLVVSIRLKDVNTKMDKLASHKYHAGSCLEFDARAWNFEKTSSGDIIGQFRVEYVRYEDGAAYYGLKVIDNDKGDWTKPIFRAYKGKSTVLTVWARYIDEFPYIGQFSYVDYAPGSKTMTIRNGMTCIHDWKD